MTIIAVDCPHTKKEVYSRKQKSYSRVEISKKKGQGNKTTIAMYLIQSRSTNVLRYFVDPGQKNENSVQGVVADAEKSSRIPGLVEL